MNNLNLNAAAVRVLNRATPHQNTIGISPDVFSDRVLNATKKNDGIAIVLGTVLRASTGSYDIEVDVHGRIVTCSFVLPTTSYTFGYKSVQLPVEGQTVMVVMQNLSSSFGFILGVLPATKKVIKDSDKKEFVPLLQIDSDIDYFHVKPYKKPNDDKNYTHKKWSGSHRPGDLFQGEYAILNENGCGLICSMFSSSIRGGGATVETCYFDASVRINTRCFQKYSSLGSEVILADGKYITEEKCFSYSIFERLGVKNGEVPFEDEQEKGVKNKKKKQTIRSRFKEFTGFLGGMVTRFIGRPDNSISPLTKDDQPKDSGVYYENTDFSGKTMIRAAGGFSIERYDRIPVAFRKMNPENPEGDKNVKYGALDKFNWNENVHYRPLELTDAQAWHYRNAYQRFDEQSKNFYVPEQDELPGPKNVYDPSDTNSQTVDLERNDGRKAGIYFGEDGSVIIRDAWGSEIVMEGGNITISASSNIHVQSGHTTAVIAGRDAILKAHGSAEVTATEDDVRICSHRDTIMAGKGVIIESTAEGAGPYDATDDKKPIRATGILLKSGKSSIVTDCSFLFLKSKEGSYLVTGTKEKTRDGVIFISSGNVITSADEAIISSCKTNSALILQPGSASLASDGSCQMFAKESISLVKDDELAIPLYGKIKEPHTDELLKTIKDANEAYQNEEMYPYKQKDLQKMYFRFVSSTLYKTMSGTESYRPSPAFTLYQPGWVLVSKGSSGLIQGSTQTWTEKKINDTYPWPGKEAWTESGKYAYIEKALNVDGKCEKSRKSIVNHSEVRTKQPLDGNYVILN